MHLCTRREAHTTAGYEWMTTVLDPPLDMGPSSACTHLHWWWAHSISWLKWHAPEDQRSWKTRCTARQPVKWLWKAPECWRLRRFSICRLWNTNSIQTLRTCWPRGLNSSQLQTTAYSSLHFITHWRYLISTLLSVFNHTITYTSVLGAEVVSVLLKTF